MSKFRWKGKGGYGDRIIATTNDPNNWYGYGNRTRFFFNPDFKVKPGKIELDPKLIEWARPYGGRVMIEPNIKGRFSAQNKAWKWSRWQELVNRTRWDFVQCGPQDARALDNVVRVTTPTFWHAVAVLYHSRGLITTEGGLHHAAGALGKPAVVLFSAFNSPELLGYEFHRNIWYPNPDGLGWRHDHPACKESMNKISVSEVVAAARELFGQG